MCTYGKSISCSEPWFLPLRIKGLWSDLRHNIPTTINHYQSCTCKHSNGSVISVTSQDHGLGFIEKLGVRFIDRLKAIKQIVGSTDIHCSSVGNAYPFWSQLSFGNSPGQDYYICSCVHFKSFIRKEKTGSRIYVQQGFQQCSEWVNLTTVISLSSRGSGDLLYEYKIEYFLCSKNLEKCGPKCRKS